MLFRNVFSYLKTSEQLDDGIKESVPAGGWPKKWREFPNSVALIYAQSKLALAGVTTIGQGMMAGEVTSQSRQCLALNCLCEQSQWQQWSFHMRAPTISHVALDDGTRSLRSQKTDKDLHRMLDVGMECKRNARSLSSEY